VIAGRSHGVDGAMQRETTEPLYLDLELPAGASFAQRCRRRTTRSSTCIAANRRSADEVPVQRMAILNNDAGSDGVVLRADVPTRALLIAGQAARRADCAVRSVRDEHERRDLPGRAGLPGRKFAAGK
jgi:redox-sensitive bicupin YhaK (pirin superfamily)